MRPPIQDLTPKTNLRNSARRRYARRAPPLPQEPTPVTRTQQVRAAPYQPCVESPTFVAPAEQTMALSQVERPIETEIQQYEQPPSPPPMMQRKLGHVEPSYARYQASSFTQPYQRPVTQSYPAHQYAYSAPKAQLSSDVLPAGALASDAMTVKMDLISAQLSLPPIPTYGQFVRRIRDFDKPPHMGGWLPRPPPSPIDPSGKANFPRGLKIRSDQTYKPRVRREKIPHPSKRGFVENASSGDLAGCGQS